MRISKSFVVACLTVACSVSLPAVSRAQDIDWSGFYAGLTLEGDGLSAHAGPGSSSGGGPGYDFTGSGGLVGGVLGMNMQDGQMIYGGELALSVGDITGINDPLTVPSITIKGVATARARVGYAINQMVLFGTAALSVAGADAFETHTTTAGSSGMNFGGGFGVGIDYAVTDQMVVQLAVEHIGYAPATYSFPEDSTHTHEVGFSTSAVRVSLLWNLDP